MENQSLLATKVHISSQKGRFFFFGVVKLYEHLTPKLNLIVSSAGVIARQEATSP